MDTCKHFNTPLHKKLNEVGLSFQWLISLEKHRINETNHEYFSTLHGIFDYFSTRYKISGQIRIVHQHLLLRNMILLLQMHIYLEIQLFTGSQYPKIWQLLFSTRHENPLNISHSTQSIHTSDALTSDDDVCHRRRHPWRRQRGRGRV